MERVSSPLTLHAIDPMTGNEDLLSTLFYEYYRGYTIYSTSQGTCYLYGSGKQGCLRLHGKFVSFPDVEAAKEIIKYFQAHNLHSWESMDRTVPRGLCTE